MSSRLSLAWIFFGLLTVLPADQSQLVTTAAAPHDGFKAGVLQADQARLDAMLRADVTALDDLLVADCLYVHSSGSVQTKPELLGALAGGALHYKVLHFAAPPLVRFYGTGTAVLTGTMELEVQPKDRPVAKALLLVTTVYVFQQERWRLASYQSTAMPR